MQKRGISPLIATILIIGFTIVLAAMVMQWGTTLLKGIQEQTGKTAELKITCTGISNLEIVPLSPSEIRLNNNNDVALEGFIFRSYVGDDIITTEIPMSIDKLGSRKFTILTNYNKGIPNKVGVFPKVMTSDGKIATCDSELTKDISTTPTKLGLDLTWASQLQLTQLKNAYKNGKPEPAPTGLDSLIIKFDNPPGITQTPVPDGTSVSKLTGSISLIAINDPADPNDDSVIEQNVTFSGIVNGDRLAISVVYIDPINGVISNVGIAGSLIDTNADNKIDASEGALAVVFGGETVEAAAIIQALFKDAYAEYYGVAS